MEDLDYDTDGLAGVSLMICRRCRWTGQMKNSKTVHLFDHDVHLCPNCNEQLNSILPVIVM